MPGQSAEERAAALLAAGVPDPLGNRVCMTPASLEQVLGDHPDVTAESVLAAVTDPSAVWEHAWYMDSLVYEATVRVAAGHGRLMVVADRDPRNVVYVVTAFFPTREGYWEKNLGRRVWPNAS